MYELICQEAGAWTTPSTVPRKEAPASLDPDYSLSRLLIIGMSVAYLHIAKSGAILYLRCCMSDLVLERSIPDCVGFLRRSSRSDLIAVIAGLTVLPLMHFLRSPAFKPSLTAFLFLLSLSFGSAFLAASRASTAVIPLHCVIPAGARMGARMGFITFLVGGGMALLAGVIHYLKLGIAPGDFGWSVPTLATTAGILLTILPTIAAGALGVAWRFGLPGVLGERLRGKAREKDRHRRTVGTVIWGSVATFMLCLASPAILAIRANRPPVELVSPSNPPTAHAFEYAVPAGLPDADAARWTIADRRPLDGLVPGASAALSKDGRYLAYARDRGSYVVVRDLATDVEWRRFSVSPSAGNLAWSNDGKRIFLTTNSTIKPFWMLKVEDGTAAPVPLTSSVNADRLEWRRDNEIDFYVGAHLSAVLELSQPRMRVVSAGYDDSGGTILVDPFPATSRCQLEVGPCLETAESPLAMERDGWGFRSKPGLFVVDRQTGRRVQLVTQNIGFGTSFLVSSDCSKIVSISPQGAWTSYVALRDKHTDGLLRATLPETPESLLDNIGSNNRLAAFVYAPRDSSPNGKAGAPDFSRVRCLAFLESRDGRDATFHVAESYRPTEPGDVIGCWHFWIKGSPVVIAGVGVDDWSPPVSEVPLAGEQKAFPSRAWEYAKFQRNSTGLTLIGYGPQPVDEHVGPIFRLAHAPATAPPPTIPNTPDPPPSTGRPSRTASEESEQQEPVQARVEQFVRAHHAKVGNHDIAGFVDDYAQAAEINGRKGVTRESIRRDQEAYLPRYDRLSETVVGVILARKTETGWSANYNMRSFAIVKRDGSTSDRMVSLTLDLVEIPGHSFEIVREQAAAN